MTSHQTPPLDAYVSNLPGPITEDTVDSVAFDDDKVSLRRICSEVDSDRYGMEALFVPGWDAMDSDARVACGLSLTLSLGDDLCERQLGADSNELTMTLDDVGDDGEFAIRRFAVSSAVATLLDGVISPGDSDASDGDASDGDASDGDASDDDSAAATSHGRVFSLFAEITVSEGVAMIFFARVPAEVDAHERAIHFLASCNS